MEEHRQYWVAYRAKGGRWIKTGPHQNREAALLDRNNMKDSYSEVEVPLFRTRSEMEAEICDLNGEASSGS